MAKYFVVFAHLPMALLSFLVCLLTLFVSANWIDEIVSLRAERQQKVLFDGVGEVFTSKAARLPDRVPFEIQAHGTTTLAFKHKDSVVVCVDSKASIGNYVGSRTVKKVFPISKTVMATMAGGAADCAFWIKQIATMARIVEFKYCTPLSVQALAKLLADTLRDRRGADLSVGTMVAGVDSTGPALYYVDSEGTCVEGDLFCVGSGSQSAYSVLDSSPPLPSLRLDEALDTALWAVRHATMRDGFSGGYINVLVINSTGIFPVKRVDCRRMPISLRGGTRIAQGEQ